MSPVRLRQALWYLAAGMIVFWVLTPVLLIGLAAFTPRSDLYRWPKPVFPSYFTTETARFFIYSYGVLASFRNSAVAAVLTLGLTLVIGAPAGYAVARYIFPGREAFRIGILLTRMFPTSLLAIPLTVTFIRWNLYDTVLGVALMHTAIALPFAVLITSGIFAGVPKELEEAATTLGCTRIGAFLRVALPLALPGLAAAGMFTFVISWNEVFASAILTVHNRTLPAQVLTSLEVAPLDFRFAGGFFMLIPALIFIALARRYLFQMWGGAISGR